MDTFSQIHYFSIYFYVYTDSIIIVAKLDRMLFEENEGNTYNSMTILYTLNMIDFVWWTGNEYFLI